MPPDAGTPAESEAGVYDGRSPADDISAVFPGLEYLVFSSHKSATQTITRSLRDAGHGASHCHTLELPGFPIPPGRLAEFAASRRAPDQCLQIVTVFREPVERLVSSMFQWHGVGAVRTGEVAGNEQTIIHAWPVERLRDYFVDEFSRHWGDESIPELARELSIPLDALEFDAGSGIGRHEHRDCTLHLLRFDLFAARPEALLSAITGHRTTVQNANLGDRQWYRHKYAEFRRALRLPEDVVERLYSERRELVRIFHPEGFDAALAAARARYCAPR